jgi:hypothetical protein
VRRALTLALLATAALTGCGGGDDAATLSKADVAVLERFESDLLAYRATADRITARFEDPSLDARGVRRASRADIAELFSTAQRIADAAASTESTTLRDLLLPAGRHYTEDATRLDDLVDAYARNDPEAAAELTFTSQSAREDFAAAQAGLLAAARDELPEESYARLRTVLAGATG